MWKIPEERAKGQHYLWRTQASLCLHLSSAKHSSLTGSTLRPQDSASSGNHGDVPEMPQPKPNTPFVKTPQRSLLTSERTSSCSEHAFTPTWQSLQNSCISVTLLISVGLCLMSLFHPVKRQAGWWGLYNPDEEVAVTCYDPLEKSWTPQPWPLPLRCPYTLLHALYSAYSNLLGAMHPSRLMKVL